MILEFAPAAEQELAEVTAYYEVVEPGLGGRFRKEVESATFGTALANRATTANACASRLLLENTHAASQEQC